MKTGHFGDAVSDTAQVISGNGTLSIAAPIFVVSGNLGRIAVGDGVQILE